MIKSKIKAIAGCLLILTGYLAAADVTADFMSATTTNLKTASNQDGLAGLNGATTNGTWSNLTVHSGVNLFGIEDGRFNLAGGNRLALDTQATGTSTATLNFDSAKNLDGATVVINVHDVHRAGDVNIGGTYLKGKAIDGSEVFNLYIACGRKTVAGDLTAQQMGVGYFNADATTHTAVSDQKQEFQEGGVITLNFSANSFAITADPTANFTTDTATGISYNSSATNLKSIEISWVHAGQATGVEFNSFSVSGDDYEPPVAGNVLSLTASSTEITFNHSDLLSTDNSTPMKDQVGIGSDIDGAWTCEFWLKMTALPATNTDAFITKGATGSENFMAIGVRNGEVMLYNNNSIRRFDYTSNQITAGDWTHVAIVVPGDNSAQLYLDGVFIGNKNVGANVNNKFRMAKLNPGNSMGALGTELDELRIWTEARSSSQINSNMDKTYNTDNALPAELALYYKFDNQTGDIDTPSTNLVGDYTEGETVDVYILAGQSNMQGNAKLSSIDASYKQPREKTYFWNGTDFEKMVIGTTQISSRIDEFGPEVGFTYELEQNPASNKICIIKYHVSGQPLHYGWNGGTWVGGVPADGTHRSNFYPGETQNALNYGSLYNNMKNKVQAGLNRLNTNRITYVIKGIVWMQGEQDSKAEQSANEYAQSLKKLKEILQLDANSGDVPLVFGQVLPHAHEGGGDRDVSRFTHRTEVRQSMANAHYSSGHADSIPNVYMVPTEAYPHNGDQVHFSGPGYIGLGREFAIKTLFMQGL